MSDRLDPTGTARTDGLPGAPGRATAPAGDPVPGRVDAPGGTDPGPDAAAVARDDRALDALIGLDPDGPGRTDDPALRLLAAWRDDLAVDVPVTRPAPLPRVRRPAPDAPRPDRSRPGRRTDRRRRRAGRLVLVAGFAVLAAGGFGGVAMAAGGAAPDSPLFPVTKVIYPDRAAAREHQVAADADVEDARRAAREGRDDDARRFLADADRHVRHLPDEAARPLRRKADQVRRGLGPSNGGGRSQQAGPPPAGSSGPPSPSTDSTGSPSTEPSPSDASESGTGDTPKAPGGGDDSSGTASEKQTKPARSGQPTPHGSAGNGDQGDQN